MVLVVAAILALGIGSFVGARWWLARDTSGTASAPASGPTDPTPTTGTGLGKDAPVPAGPAASPATPTPTAPQTTVTSAVVVTATVTAVSTAGPTVAIAPATTAAAAPDLAVVAGVPRQDVGCGDGHVVVLASALNRGDFESAAAGLGPRFPGAKYLITGSSCLNFRSQSAFVLYEGPYATVSDACAARFAGTRDAYVKVADPSVTDRTVGCLCPPPGALPDLGSGSDGPYVTEAQYALQRLGFYAGDGTGVFDADTESAVRTFQSGKALPIDGRLTASTWPALTAADCAV